MRIDGRDDENTQLENAVNAFPAVYGIKKVRWYALVSTKCFWWLVWPFKRLLCHVGQPTCQLCATATNVPQDHVRVSDKVI